MRVREEGTWEDRNVEKQSREGGARGGGRLAEGAWSLILTMSCATP